MGLAVNHCSCQPCVDTADIDTCPLWGKAPAVHPHALRQIQIPRTCSSFWFVEPKNLVLLQRNLGMKSLVPINPLIEFKVFLDFRPQFSSVSNQTEYPFIRTCCHGSGSFEPSKLIFSICSNLLQFSIFFFFFGKSLLIISQDENSKFLVLLLWNYCYRYKFWSITTNHWTDEKLLLDEIQYHLYFVKILCIQIISILFQYQNQYCHCFTSLESLENIISSSPGHSFSLFHPGPSLCQTFSHTWNKLSVPLADTLP